MLNDNHNTFQGVAFALSSTIPGVDYDKGMGIADRIHNSGRAVVWSGHKEAAELYWEKLKAFGLTMAPLEPGVLSAGTALVIGEQGEDRLGRRRHPE